VTEDATTGTAAGALSSDRSPRSLHPKPSAMSPDLPASPLWLRVTVENPWPLAIALAVALLLAGRAADVPGRRRSLLAAGVLLPVLLVLTARLVETTSEQVEAATRAMIADVLDPEVRADVAAAHFHEEFRLRIGGETSGWGRDDVVARIPAIRALVDRNALRDIHAGPDPASSGEARSRFAQTTATTIGRPVPNTWTARWRRDPADDRWRIVELDWIAWGLNETPSPSMLPGGR